MSGFIKAVFFALIVLAMGALLFSVGYAGAYWYLTKSTRLFDALNADPLASINRAWSDVTILKDYSKLLIAGPIAFFGMLILAIMALRMGLRKNDGAKFASLSDIKGAGFLEKGGIFIGRFGGFSYYVWGPHRERGSGKRRLFQKRIAGGRKMWIDGDDVGGFMIGPPRSGKGTGIIIPNALSWPDSLVVLDMRGETYEATAGHRATFTKVVRFAPADPDGDTEFYNPFDFIRLDPAQRDIDIRNMAAAIFPTPPGSTDPYWVKDARLLFSGFSSFVLESKSLPDEKRNIRAVLDIMNSADETILEFIGSLNEERRSDASDYTRRILLPYLDMSEKQFSGLYANIRTELTPFLNELVTKATSKSTFDIRALRKDRMTIYLDFRVQQIATLGPLFNILISQMMIFLSERMPAKDEHRVLILLDEFQNLGKLENVMAMATILGGYGAPTWFFVQSLKSVDTIYQVEGRENLINSARVQIFFGAQAQGDLRYISETLGESVEIKKDVTKTQASLFDTFYTRSTHQREVRGPLMRPEQVRTMSKNHCLIIPRGFAPIYGTRNFYFADPALRKNAWKTVPKMSGSITQTVSKSASIAPKTKNEIKSAVAQAGSLSRGTSAQYTSVKKEGVVPGAAFAARARSANPTPVRIKPSVQMNRPVINDKIETPSSEVVPDAIVAPLDAVNTYDETEASIETKKKSRKRPNFTELTRSAVTTLNDQSETEKRVLDALQRVAEFKKKSSNPVVVDEEIAKLETILPDVL